MARSVCTARFPLPINHSALGGLGERSAPGRNPQPRPRTRAPSEPTLSWDLPGEAMRWGRVLWARSSRGAVPGPGASPPARVRAAEGHTDSSAPARGWGCPRALVPGGASLLSRGIQGMTGGVCTPWPGVPCPALCPCPCIPCAEALPGCLRDRQHPAMPVPSPVHSPSPSPVPIPIPPGLPHRSPPHCPAIKRAAV